MNTKQKWRIFESTLPEDFTARIRKRNDNVKFMEDLYKKHKSNIDKVSGNLHHVQDPKHLEEVARLEK
jgi:hypothetical protein